MSRSVCLTERSTYRLIDNGCRTCSNELDSSAMEQDTGICTGCYFALLDDEEELQQAIRNSQWEAQQDLASHYASA